MKKIGAVIYNEDHISDIDFMSLNYTVLDETIRKINYNDK